jgi:cytochrome c-type biogenesis protein CcmH
MNVFLLIAAAMAATAVYFPLSALLRQPHRSAALQVGDDGRDGLNLNVLRDQLRELDADLHDGTIDAHGYGSARQELQRRVVSEIGSLLPPPSLRATSVPRWQATLLALAVPAVAGTLYFFLGTPAALIPVQLAAAGEERQPPMSAQQIEGMVSGLAAKLKSNPNDADGWRMLARSYETMRRFDLAVGAYRRLVLLRPDDADLLADYAVTLAMSLDQNLSGEPEKLIHRALEIDPQNIQALALSGSAAFERKDYANAVKSWQQILTLVSADSDMGRSIAAGIAKAESLAEGSKEAP